VQTKVGAVVFSEMAHLHYTMLGNPALNRIGVEGGGNSGPFSAVPEPAYAHLLALGLGALMGLKRART